VACGILGLFALQLLGDGVKAAFGAKVSPKKVLNTNEAAMVATGPDGFSEKQRATLFAVFGKMTNRLNQASMEVSKLTSKETSILPKHKEPEQTVIGLCRGKAGVAVTFSDGVQILAQEVETHGREVAVDGIIYQRGVGKVDVLERGKKL